MAEKVLLVTVEFRNEKTWPLKDITDELEELVVSCGGGVIERVICKYDTPQPRFLIGNGKVKDIAHICQTKAIDTVIVSHNLKGSQQRNLEEACGVKVIDRTQLILDIFARRAKSMEGKMQVELAQLDYLLPRLVGHGEELSRLGGGIGTVGPGETKLETDRRRISARISKLKKDLKEVSLSRKTKRKKRQEQHIPSVALVGYTNAGKSTLLNTLTKANQEAADALFTTLDPLSRQMDLANHQRIILSDTVGFMHELPHNLIEAFKATLEEVTEADILLHVLDVSNPKFQNLHGAVMDVLKELEVKDKPIVTVLNKIDRVEDKNWLAEVQRNFENAVCISASQGENIQELMDKISEFVVSTMTEIDVKIPLNRMDLVNLVHKEGRVHSVEYLADGIQIRAVVPFKVANKIQ